MSAFRKNSCEHAHTVLTARFLVAFICLAFLCATEVAAQGPVTRAGDNDPAPPPMKFIPGESRDRLSLERDLKGRTKLSLELAASRLTSAESQTQAERFDEAGIELGVYQALIADAIEFLQKQGRRDNKIRDNFKRIDLALREHTPRIEKIRRTTPAQSAVHVKEALDFVRQSRTDALESFYGETVLREKPLQDKKDQRAKSRPDEPESKP
jgi:hypothetical protein